MKSRHHLHKKLEGHKKKHKHHLKQAEYEAHRGMQLVKELAKHEKGEMKHLKRKKMHHHK